MKKYNVGDEVWYAYYEVGDEVWYAYYEMTGVKKPCPVCFGRKEVTLILGNTTHVVLPCDYCGKGFSEPTGQITEYEYVAQAELVTITSIDSRIDAISDERRYYYGGGRFADIQDLFDTEAEALARCHAKIKQRETEDTTLAQNLKTNQHKTFTWNAGYHLRQAQYHRKQTEYHELKAILCKDRAKLQKGVEESK